MEGREPWGDLPRACAQTCPQRGGQCGACAQTSLRTGAWTRSHHQAQFCGSATLRRHGCVRSWLTGVSRPAHRFLRRQVSWSAVPISWRIFQFFMIHTVKGFGIVNKAEVDAFLEFFCFFYDPVDVVNLISGSSAFSKSSLNIWNNLWFTNCWSLAWRILSITLLACEMSAIVQWFEHSLALLFFGTGMKTDLFQTLWPLLSFPNLLTYWVQHFNSIIF